MAVGIGRTLTGAWIETTVVDLLGREAFVAPSRVRGLKPTGGRWLTPD